MGEAFRRQHDGVQTLRNGSVSMEATDSLQSSEALHMTGNCGPLAPLPDPAESAAAQKRTPDLVSA